MANSMRSTSSNRSSFSKKGKPLNNKPTSSRVDETLFGPPARLQQMTGNRTWTSSTGNDSFYDGMKTDSRKGGRTGQPKVVEVVTKDLIRTLKVPKTPDPSGMSVILDTNQFDRIKWRSAVLSPEDQKFLEEEIKLNRLKKMEDSNSRKKLMQDFELERKTNEKPSDLEQESMKEGSQLVSRAKVQMEEQDDEIKQLNEVILNAKCHAIRDAQLQEKEEITKFMEEEEKRLDLMMEVERLKSLQDYEEREKQKNIQRLQGAKVIHQQIEDNEFQRLLEAERRDQQTQQLIKYMQKLQQEDWDNLQKKRQAQKSLMEEVTQCNNEISRQKMQQREQEKLEEFKILDYLKEKEKREEEQQKEQERLRIEKEKEVARLRAQQEKAKDKLAERDALRAKRNQEQFEREWRRKQKEEAQKKKETEDHLCKAREDQVQHKEHFLAVQAQRERTEFERVLEVQRDQMSQDEQNQLNGALRRKAHVNEVRNQIKDRENELTKTRRSFFDEGIKLDQEAKERRAKLDEIKQRKLSELRQVGIPEKYCAEVSRRITAPPPSFIAH